MTSVRHRIYPYLMIARPDHWVKHIFIIPGILIAERLDPAASLRIIPILVGTLSACLLASANYVLNEFLDAESDKFHPIKKHRIAVTQSLSPRYVYLEYGILLGVGLILASFVNIYFLLTAVVFVFMAVLYNVPPIRLKDYFLADVLSESLNNPLRLLFGWFMLTSVTVPPSSILLAYWFGGAFLMAAKRFSEYRRLITDVPLETVAAYRKSFGAYSETSLVGSMFCYAMLCGLLMSAFILLYRLEYFLTLPFLVALFTYYVMFSFERDSAVQAPERLHSNPILIALMSLLFISFVVLTYVDVPLLEQLLGNPVQIEAIINLLTELFK